MMRKAINLVVVLLMASLLLFQPAWASTGCPEGWTPVGGWYREGNTCKLRCSQPGQSDWWMDSGSVSRPGCEALHSPAPTYYDIWGDRQAPMNDCRPDFEPEHTWFRQGDTCLLKCVDKSKVDLLMGLDFDRHGWLNIPITEKQVYMDSRGESRPPWCILEN